MLRRYKNLYPLVLSSLAYLLLALWCLRKILDGTAGTQVFLLDDPYIHASMARNLLIHGTLSVSPSGFSSSSSSIVWPFLVAFCFAIFGIHLWVLLALNAAFALLSVCR